MRSLSYVVDFGFRDTLWLQSDRSTSQRFYNIVAKSNIKLFVFFSISLRVCLVLRTNTCLSCSMKSVSFNMLESSIRPETRWCALTLEWDRFARERETCTKIKPAGDMKRFTTDVFASAMLTEYSSTVPGIWLTNASLHSDDCARSGLLMFFFVLVVNWSE